MLGDKVMLDHRCQHCGFRDPVGGLYETTRRPDLREFRGETTKELVCEVCMDSTGTMRWLEGDMACGEAIDRARIANTIRADIRKLVRLIVSGRPV